MTVAETYRCALLIKTGAFDNAAIRATYFDALATAGINTQELIAYPLPYQANNKAPVKYIRAALEELLPELSVQGIDTLYVADASYFKVLTGQAKAEAHLGYVMPCVIEDFTHLNIVLGINYQSLIYTPANEPKLTQSIEALIDHLQGKGCRFDAPLLTEALYPRTHDEIREALDALLVCDQLAMDIETYSLRIEQAGLASVAIATNGSSGLAFMLDDQKKRDLLRDFLVRFATAGYADPAKRLIFHNASFDVKILIYELFMTGPRDYPGLVNALELLMPVIDDTRLLAYLVYNSTADISLSLKDLVQRYAGNYAMNDISDVTKIPENQLLEYNLIDAACTYWLYEDLYPKLTKENQRVIYYDLFQPSLGPIIHMELIGIPIDPVRTREARAELEQISEAALQLIHDHPVVLDTCERLKTLAYEKDYTDRRDKAKNPEKIVKKVWKDFPDTVFNPNSGPHLRELLYNQLQCPVLERTPTGQPATGADVLKKLAAQPDMERYGALFKALVSFGEAQKITTTFLTAFEEKSVAFEPDAERHYLRGNFNLGGTVSGRLSSSSPNLQNLPSSSTYGKLVKSCVSAEPDWVFAGADFSSLEDRVSALTTGDPAKLQVYTDGYDGHCLRAYSYFGDQMPDIVSTVASINSIEDRYPELRQLSKAPTFLLTYQGTFLGLMHNCGFDEITAKTIEHRYHALYKISDQWVSDRIDQAQIDGYITGAFGLKVRTPLLHKTPLDINRVSLRHHRKIPPVVRAEARTAGNALGQSWGLLTNRAMNAFMSEVYASEHRNAIQPIMMIHDALYFLVADDPTVLTWFNTTLIRHMRWQEDPAIAHPSVTMEASVELYDGSWAKPITLPNDIDEDTLIDVVIDARAAHADANN